MNKGTNQIAWHGIAGDECMIEYWNNEGLMAVPWRKTRYPRHGTWYERPGTMRACCVCTQRYDTMGDCE